MEKICKQIDFYFSDFNLHHDRYLRSMIAENSLIPVDVLFGFNLIQQLLSSIDDNGDDQSNDLKKKKIIEKFEHYRFENVRYIVTKQSFERFQPFVYDKNGYLKSKIDSIVHLSRLSSSKMTISSMIEWISSLFNDDDNGQNSFYGINVCKRNKDNPNFIRSALIVLKNEECVRILQEKINESGNNDIRLVSYRDYLRYKNKSRMKRRQQKRQETIRQKLEKMTITKTGENIEESKAMKPKQKHQRIRLLVARRTLVMTGIPDPIAKSLLLLQDKDSGVGIGGDGRYSFKQYLQPLGLIYLYQPKLERKSTENGQKITKRDYYLFFKNRTTMLQFYKRLTETEEESYEYHKSSMITGKNISLINMVNDNDNNDLPRRFKHYVRCIRRFFQNPKSIEQSSV
ncbi:hypothetical protein DERP_006595 [Dermatophagoides pteronyssinus]|uniref:HTH La-type RNA-binding domain-containing protein n=1 Tax=Dermatophagoides pteronyssinus TaxID=6956 RepID=A0ABQ8IR20_DERPT|nr:hypothetical protein DERP_006595 [Dermatophagoides pteronyssinus]